MQRSKLIGWTTASIAAVLLGEVAGAATYHWDANGAADGTGGPGTWNTSSSLWRLDGTGPLTSWSNSGPHNAVFGGTAGTVTLGTNPGVGTIQFDAANYILETNQATITVSDFSGSDESSATIRPVVASSGDRSNTITVPGSAVATYSGLIINNGAATFILKKDGAGTLKLTNTNSSFGANATVAISILNGTLEVANLANGGTVSPLGAGLGRISFVGDGAVFKYTGGVSDSGTTNRGLNFTATTAATTGIVDASGVTPLVLTNDEVRVESAGYVRVLKLTGSSVADNRLDGKFINATSSLVKEGEGKWIITSNLHTYSGGTTIKAGLLAVNNSTLGASGVGAGDVSIDGGTLGGTGYIGKSSDASNISFTANGGGIAPGSGGAGRLTVYGDLNFTSAGTKTFVIDIAGTTVVTDYDQLQVNSATGATGAVTLDGATLNLNVTFAPLVGSTFTILDKVSAGDITGTFAGLTEGAEFNSGSSRFKISYVGGNGNDVVLTTVPIPEPTALGLLTLAGMMLRRRRAL